jgi:hypothetical protein
VKTLKKLDMLRFYDKYVAMNAPCRRKLCVHVVAKQHEDEDDDGGGGTAIAAAAAETALAAADKEEKLGGEEEEMKEPEVKTDAAAVIRIDNPIDFRHSMPLYPMPHKANVDVVDVGINK